MNEETIELSCEKCKSRRNLIAIFGEGKMSNPVLANVYCARHYTDYLKSKIVRLDELLGAKKPVTKKG